MEGNKLDSMVRAVYGSAAVVVCCSDALAASGQCRAECRLAFEFDKIVLIAKFQAGFVPGRRVPALSILAASTTYCNFTQAHQDSESGRAAYASALETLVQQLDEVGTPRRLLVQPTASVDTARTFGGGGAATSCSTSASVSMPHATLSTSLHSAVRTRH